jgi:hypothetical protein
LQEDIEIDHVQADEQKRQLDVQQGMIKQVDDLVEYFNSLYQDDQQGIRWAGIAAKWLHAVASHNAADAVRLNGNCK